MKGFKLAELLDTETQQLNKLNQIVIDAIEEEKLLSSKLNDFEQEQLSTGRLIADRVAIFGGSWKFVIAFLSLMSVWMAYNALLPSPFDPYPFILLNLLLSTIAALQAPIIMMSQNRKEEKDRKRSINDYLINLKSEIEIRNMHQKLDLLIAEQMKTMFEIQNVQVELMDEIRTMIGGKGELVPAGEQLTRSEHDIPRQR